MNAERLLEVYEQISEAPDAIPRLRRFVLDLAVRGKLVDQDASDEPASHLLEKIEERKAAILKETGMRKPRNVADMNPAEIWADLPANWAWTQISNLGLISPRNVADDDAEASFVPMPMIFAEYGIANNHAARLWGEIKKGYTHFADGDVGLAKITPCFENGKSTVFRNLTGGFGSGTTELHVLRPVLVAPDYVVLFLKSPQFIETGIPKMTGTAGQKRISSEYFTSSPFPLPPLAEQHRIAAKVDELMALCDRLEEARKTREKTRDKLTAASLARLTAPDTTPEEFPAHAAFALEALPALTTRPDQINTLRQTILNLAVRGKLVEQDPIEGSGEELMAEIEAKQIARSTTRANTTLIDFAPPGGWALRPLEAIIQDGPKNGLSPTKSEKHDAPKAITLTATTSGYFDERHFKRVDVSLEAAEPFWLQPNDLLFQRGNTREYVGMAAIYDGPEREFLYPDLIMRVRVIPEMYLRYVHLWCIAPVARSYFAANATGAQKTMPKINQGVLKALPIMIPPLTEQHRIVAKVETLMTLCDRLETALTTADTTRTRLLEALLHEALEPEAEVLEAAE